MMTSDEQSLPYHIFSICINPCQPPRHADRTQLGGNSYLWIPVSNLERVFQFGFCGKRDKASRSYWRSGSIQIYFTILTFFLGRDDNLRNFSACVKQHVRTPSSFFEVNGKIERKHSDLGVTRGLVQCEAPVEAKRWRFGTFAVSSRRYEFLLRLCQKKEPNNTDC